MQINLASIWFKTYREVLDQNNMLSSDKLGTSQLKEVTTSIFIAKTQKNIWGNEGDSDDNYEIPEDYAHLADRQSHQRNDITLATDGQITCIQKLAKDSRITENEKARIESLLAGSEISKTKANSILSHFWGVSRKQGNTWVKVSSGVLSQRKAHHHHA